MSNSTLAAVDVHSTSAADNFTREWCTAAEAASIARVSTRRVHAAVHAGQLRAAVVDARGTVRVHRNWIAAWLERLADEHPSANQPSGRLSLVSARSTDDAPDRNGDGNAA